MTSRFRQRVLLAIAALLLTSVSAPGVAAHEGITVGEYVLEVGWRTEPAYPGQLNAIQLTITRGDTSEPVTDLDAGALSVVATTAGVAGPSLALVPADAVAGTGSPGRYEAELVPPSAGDYTLHLTGSIHDTPVDVSAEAEVDVQGPAEPSSPDLVLIGGGAALLLVLGGMAFLLLRVRPTQQP